MMKKKVFVTGDMHGEYGRAVETCNYLNQYTDKDDVYLIVTGDFGYLFNNDFQEKKLLDEFEQQKFTIIVIPGNHENYKAFKEYEIVEFNGAKAHQVRKNIYYICRGEIFELEGNCFFCMGGGYSIDRYMRKLDISYWKEEMPKNAEFIYAIKQIEAHRKSGKCIDYILSHTAPLSGLAYLGKNHGLEEKPLNNFLEYVRELTMEECIMHYYGHLHMDKELTSIKQRVLWFDYVEVVL